MAGHHSRVSSMAVAPPRDTPADRAEEKKKQKLQKQNETNDDPETPAIRVGIAVIATLSLLSTTTNTTTTVPNRLPCDDYDDYIGDTTVTIILTTRVDWTNSRTSAADGGEEGRDGRGVHRARRDWPTDERVAAFFSCSLSPPRTCDRSNRRHLHRPSTVRPGVRPRADSRVRRSGRDGRLPRADVPPETDGHGEPRTPRSDLSSFLFRREKYSANVVAAVSHGRLRARVTRTVS